MNKYHIISTWSGATSVVNERVGLLMLIK